MISPAELGSLLEAHNAAISALATAVSALAAIVVALFTYTLSRGTTRLWRTSQEQARQMEESVAIARAGADAATTSARVTEQALALVERAFVAPRVQLVAF